MRIHFPIVLVCCVLFLGGCSSNAPTGSNSPLSIASPNVGSTFQYREIEIDSTGKITDTVAIVTRSVLATGITQYDKTNVTQYSNGFINYDANGDIEVYRSSYNKGWIMIPLASKGTGISILQDTAVDQSDTYSYTYAGTGQRTINSITFTAEQFEVEVDDGFNQPTHWTDWYDARTGVLIETDFSSGRKSNGAWYARRFEITSFNLK
jgi:hypothetical protein